MKVLVTGDRFHDDPWIVSAVLQGLYTTNDISDGFVVIEGQCPKGGADLYAEQWAKAHAEEGVEHLPFPADWEQYGKSAGPIRNRQMLKEGKPDLVVAFHDDLFASKGTKDMVDVAMKAGVPVYHIRRCGVPKLF